MRVKLDCVGHRFGAGPWLFRGLNYELTAGEMWAVTGASGSGKSTLLELLAGWSAPEEGKITRPDRLQASWVAQNPFGVAGRSVVDHVVLALLAQGRSRADALPAARMALARFNIDHLEDKPFAPCLAVRRSASCLPGLLFRPLNCCSLTSPQPSLTPPALKA